MTPEARFTAFADDGLGHTSYLVDLGDGTALVIDPARLPSDVMADAERRGLSIAWSADTHTHADYVSGSPDLARHGATFLAPTDAGLKMSHQGLAAGDEVSIGDLRLHAIATPGHTPDHLAYLLLEDGAPIALFSGGSLMVGTVGRTDLLGAAQADGLARRLYRSLHADILTLPDDLVVYPTHGAGSFCSAPAGGDRFSTIGRERETNPLLQAVDEDEFVHRLLDGLGTFPAYFDRLPALNQVGPTHYDELPALRPMDADEVADAVEEGATVIDVRPVDRFATAHVPGSVSIEHRPSFATWLGWLIDPDIPLVFVVDDDQDARDLIRQCLTIGYESLAGALTGGIAAWTASGRPTSAIEIVDVADIAGTVLDVRQHAEYAAGHAPGARHVELGSLPDASLPDGPLTVMCGHHERAMTGASVLERRGRIDLRVLRDGYSAWREAGEPVEVTP